MDEDLARSDRHEAAAERNRGEEEKQTWIELSDLFSKLRTTTGAFAEVPKVLEGTLADPHVDLSGIPASDLIRGYKQW